MSGLFRRRPGSPNTNSSRDTRRNNYFFKRSNEISNDASKSLLDLQENVLGGVVTRQAKNSLLFARIRIAVHHDENGP